MKTLGTCKILVKNFPLSRKYCQKNIGGYFLAAPDRQSRTLDVQSCVHSRRTKLNWIAYRSVQFSFSPSAVNSSIGKHAFRTPARVLRIISFQFSSPALNCSVLFFGRSLSEGWPHHGRTFSIYPCPLSFCLTLPRRVLSTPWCCPSSLIN